MFNVRTATVKQRRYRFLLCQNIEIIDNAPNGLTNIGITGGEPTLLEEKLICLIEYIRIRYPDSLIHILTNGKAFADIHYAKKFKEIPNLLFGIPLHSDFSIEHDAITQVKGSYTETMKGLYNLAGIGADIELRIVINRMNFQRLPQLSEIYMEKFTICCIYIIYGIGGYRVFYQKS